MIVCRRQKQQKHMQLGGRPKALRVMNLHWREKERDREKEREEGKEVGRAD